MRLSTPVSILVFLLAAAPVTGSDPHDVLWTCAGTILTGKPLTTRFEPGAVVVTWQGSSWRLASVPAEVGARYATDSGEPGAARFWMRGDRSVLEAGDTAVGCRAERRDPRLPMPQPASQAPLDLATALVDGLPGVLSRLVSVVGPIPRDRSRWEEAVGPLRVDRVEGPIESVSVDLDIDFYHFDPQEEEDPSLGAWTVTFRGAGCDAVADLLRSRYGEGRELSHHPGWPRRFGPFYLTRLAAGERFRLEYHDREPSWAVPPRSDEETRLEIAKVERFLTTGIDRASLEAAFGPLVPGTWNASLEAEMLRWRISASPLEGRFAQVFITPRGTPIPAGRLISTLGITKPVVVSHDVHLSSRELEDLETGAPRIGDYRVEIAIDHAGLEFVERERVPGRFIPPTWRSADFPITGIAIRLRREN